MNQKQVKTVVKKEGLSLIVEREFDAPRELVWEAWTSPEHVAKWWGYGGVPLYKCEIDLREGGSYRYVQKGEDGSEFPTIGKYLEVVKPERLRYSMILDIAPFNEHESIVMDSFEQLSNGKTRLTMRTNYPTIEVLEASVASGAEQGAIASMERLSEYISNM
ncbi:Uncharacterized conserved protein YndB, AHSA1/START domain [Seinonella peptonophila]|uniref:Uncharacterized conserved protein YndB, AHSA1/START domain n=1 Tax=Seinonella peptonophila TaxID=112248 RepID=A0A1M4ZMP2_9BACL|nr:SRPBCC domain-containing protein [Seinonella peptonophila]SHF19313.1 Uncharacterized conserved protein YndB, AHSA1/START domain [Seinonella peptonophila]